MSTPLLRSPALLLLAALLSCSACLAQSDARPDTLSANPDWLPFEEALTQARADDKVVLVDVYTPWCGWCRKMQQEVYTDAQIRAHLDSAFVATRLNIDDTQTALAYQDYELSPKELGNAFGATGTPTTVFLDAEGNYITRLPGFVDAPTFERVLAYMGSGAYRDQTLREFVDAGSTPTGAPDDGP